MKDMKGHMGVETIHRDNERDMKGDLLLTYEKKESLPATAPHWEPGGDREENNNDTGRMG